MNRIGIWVEASSLKDFIRLGWASIILPAVASIAYAITNFGFAADISANKRREKGEDIPMPPADTFKAKLRLTGIRPETYFAIASVAVGLMAGGWSLLSLPLLAVAYLFGKVYLSRVETLATPGGFKQVMRDMKEGTAAFAGKMTGRKKTPVARKAPLSTHG